MHNRTVCGAFVLIIGFIALVDLGVAYAQVEGAVQYPPPSVGEDAQPPPPARMVPKIVLPRPLEISISGSSVAPTNPPYRIQQGGDRLPRQPAPLTNASEVPLPTERGDN
jgi:hypothetical protein